jgi:hypothetical protein
MNKITTYKFNVVGEKLVQNSLSLSIGKTPKVGAFSKLAPRYKQVDAPRKNRYLQILKSSSNMP